MSGRREDIDVRIAMLCERYDLIKATVATFQIPHHYKDDLIQDIFIKAYLNLDKLRDTGCMDKWLYTIAGRTMIAFAKKYNLKFIRELYYTSEEGELEFEDTSSKAVWEIVEDQFTNEEIRKMVMSLKPPAPQIIHLRYMLDLKLKDIADMLGMNYNTVKTIERRALKKLKEMMNKKGEAENDTANPQRG